MSSATFGREGGQRIYRFNVAVISKCEQNFMPVDLNDTRHFLSVFSLQFMLLLFLVV